VQQNTREKKMKDLGNGLYIFTQEEMIDEQAEWDDEVKGKNIDFTTSLFWLATDCGLEPEGFDTEEELMQHLSEL